MSTLQYLTHGSRTPRKRKHSSQPSLNRGVVCHNAKFRGNFLLLFRKPFRASSRKPLNLYEWKWAV